MTYRARSRPRSSTIESNESTHSWVSSGSMSGSWVGSPSWITGREVLSELLAGLTPSSLHAPQGHGIHPRVSGQPERQ